MSVKKYMAAIIIIKSFQEKSYNCIKDVYKNLQLTIRESKEEAVPGSVLNHWALHSTSNTEDK